MVPRSFNALVCVLFASLAGCGAESMVVSPEPSRVPEAASASLGRLREREYEAMYDAASPELRQTNDRDAFLERLRALDNFGRLERVEPAGEPAGSRAGGTVTAAYRVTYVLGEGSLDLSLRANQAGEWRLDGLRYDVVASTYDPPYPDSEDGADKLAVRLSYDLTFTNGQGYVDFILVDAGAEWRIDDVKYDVEYRSASGGGS
jgi:hypothetical protein